jgi:carbamoyl-phosphate synthase large subunit
MVERLNLKQPPNRTAAMPKKRRASGGRDRLSAGGAPVLRAGRSRHGNRLQRRRAAPLHAHGVQVSNDSPVLLDRFLDDAIEVDVDAYPTARTW